MSRPLQGLRVIVTRAHHQSRELVELLEHSGAIAISYPVVEIVDPDDNGAGVAKAFEHGGEYDWLIVTSVNTAERVAPYVLGFQGKIAAIGSATAEVLTEAGVEVDLVPHEFLTESLLEMFPSGEGRVLLPSAEVTRDVLPVGLQEKGWTVDVVIAYRTIFIQPDSESKTLATQADVVIFTSASTVLAFLETGVPIPPMVVCIGPVTAGAVERAGLKVSVTAEEHTIKGLMSALIREVESH